MEHVNKNDVDYRSSRFWISSESMKMINMDNNEKNVSIVRCEDYGRGNVYEAVKKSIKLLGGLGQFVSPGQKVFLKFNMLVGSKPEACVTTHPDVVYAVARLLKEYGCKVVMGDSPGGGLPYTEAVLKKQYAISGYKAVSEELNIPLNYDIGSQGVMSSSSKLMKRFSIITPALEADVIVVVSKAKTGALMGMTGGAKNIFGLVPGLEKPVYHANFPNVYDLSQVILDLNDVVKPKLQIMDAIMGQDGDGPIAGTPRKIGAVLASSDYNAIDVITARLMSLDIERMPMLKVAVERGDLKEDFNDVIVVGDALEGLIAKEFKGPSTYAGPDMANYADHNRLSGIGFTLMKETALRPHIRKDKCNGCMKCMRICPVNSITATNKKPSIDYKKCFKCYCCHEMCDSHSITLKRSIPGKILMAIVNMRGK